MASGESNYCFGSRPSGQAAKNAAGKFTRNSLASGLRFGEGLLCGEIVIRGDEPLWLNKLKKKSNCLKC